MPTPILVVDDDPMVAQLAATILERGGYEVVSADNAPQAIQIAEDNPRIDLVLSDVVMPGMSGVQAIAAKPSTSRLLQFQPEAR